MTGLELRFGKQQEAAIVAIGEWYRRREKQVYKVFGYAGTGKTTLLRELQRRYRWDVRVAAYTGKAAYVLKQKGLEGATTIHRMIYRLAEDDRIEYAALKERLEKLKEGRDDKEIFSIRKRMGELKALLGKLKFRLNEMAFKNYVDGDYEDNEPDLIVVDECSMIDEKMALDLMSFGIPILVTGDMAQLAPIEGSGFFMRGEPDSMLTEIHRQAEGSGILRMATEVREKRGWKSFGDDAVVRPQYALEGFGEWWNEYDQLLVSTNRMKFDLNKRARRAMGYRGDFPEVGERLVCLRNNHKIGLLNSTQWIVSGVHYEDRDDFIELTMQPAEMMTEADSRVLKCIALKMSFLRETQAIKNELRENYFRYAGLERFTFAYAMTGHKSQGSEWDNVAVLDDAAWMDHMPGKPKERWRWRYTAVTRAVKNVTVFHGS